MVASTEQTDAGPIREKEAKSGRSRTVALPSLAVEELRRWRVAQGEELLKLGVRCDDNWHVVTQADGTTLQPRSLTNAVSVFLKEWGVTLHKLRHSHASHLLASNVHPKIVQERLGHSSISITLDIYSHLMPNMQGEAAATVDGVLRAAITKRHQKGSKAVATPSLWNICERKFVMISERYLAGAAGLEPATPGFGDRYSTN